jgi:hypothetical protein
LFREVTFALILTFSPRRRNSLPRLHFFNDAFGQFHREYFKNAGNVKILSWQPVKNVGDDVRSL